jgi:hypothetical protein
MKNPGLALKIATVVNAILLVVAFIGCRSGGLDKSTAEGTTQDPTFMSGSKSLLTGSFQPAGIINTSASSPAPQPAATSQPGKTNP